MDLFVILYFLGMVLAIALLSREYLNTDENNRCDDNEAFRTFVVGAMLSWITIAFWPYGKHFQK